MFIFKIEKLINLGCSNINASISFINFRNYLLLPLKNSLFLIFSTISEGVHFSIFQKKPNKNTQRFYL